MKRETFESLAPQIEAARIIMDRIERLQNIILAIENDINKSGTKNYPIVVPCTVESRVDYVNLNISAITILKHAQQLKLAAEDEFSQFALNY